MTRSDRIGVVIPTHERPRRLRDLLRSLATHFRDQVGRVVVVDDSRAPSLRPQDVPELDVTVVRPDHRVFISEAKNLGLGRVDEEFVLVVDDDNVLDPSTLVHPLELVRAEAKVAAVMPSVLYLSRPELVWVYATPFRPGRWTFDLIGRNRPRDPNLESRILPTDALPNAALFRRDALRAVGGWDPALPVNSSADLCRRLKDAGHEVWADSHAMTYHAVEPPGTTAYWAQHSVDHDRLYYEMHDWAVYQRRVHHDPSGFVPRALWHAAPFVLSSLLAFTLRKDARFFSLGAQVGRGLVAGLRDRR